MPLDVETPAGITVVGVGRAAAAPDLVTVALAAVVRRDAVRAALDRVSAVAAAVTAAVRAAGVEDRDVRTADLRLEQAWDHGAKGSRPAGFEATMRIVARVRDVASAGAVVAAAVEAGGDDVRVEHVGLGLDESAAVERAAREDAMEDARHKAAHYAQLAGRTLGEVVSVVEGGDRPVHIMPMRSLAAGVADVAIEPGEQDVAVAVTVRWAFQG
jgi:uncharacterized protein YggE